jgi:hypothetical protein
MSDKNTKDENVSMEDWNRWEQELTSQIKILQSKNQKLLPALHMTMNALKSVIDLLTNHPRLKGHAKQIMDVEIALNVAQETLADVERIGTEYDVGLMYWLETVKRLSNSIVDERRLECPVCGGLGFEEYTENDNVLFAKCHYCNGKRYVIPNKDE